MKNILIAVGLLIGTLAWSEPAFTDVIAQANTPNPSYPPVKTSSAETAVDDVITILLDQGFAGAIIVILFLWTYRTDKQIVQSKRKTLINLLRLVQNALVTWQE